MTLADAISHALFPLVFLAWAELRFLPLVRTAMGWCKAHALKSGVTEKDAAQAGGEILGTK